MVMIRAWFGGFSLSAVSVTESKARTSLCPLLYSLIGTTTRRSADTKMKPKILCRKVRASGLRSYRSGVACGIVSVISTESLKLDILDEERL
jgi:hypothetical protein